MTDKQIEDTLRGNSKTFTDSIQCGDLCNKGFGWVNVCSFECFKGFAEIDEVDNE